MRTFDIIMYLLAFVSFILATFGAQSPRVNLIALGLALWITVPLVAILNL